MKTRTRSCWSLCGRYPERDWMSTKSLSVWRGLKRMQVEASNEFRALTMMSLSLWARRRKILRKSRFRADICHVVNSYSIRDIQQVKYIWKSQSGSYSTGWKFGREHKRCHRCFSATCSPGLCRDQRSVDLREPQCLQTAPEARPGSFLQNIRRKTSFRLCTGAVMFFQSEKRFYFMFLFSL